ncbi:MAG: hypothetical protein IPM50_02820 [Acidobacteriota bacterium]|nr:MAG: hypothetical protein IPM50_02820 [Acidobacteriota bacterium]
MNDLEYTDRTIIHHRVALLAKTGKPLGLMSVAITPTHNLVAHFNPGLPPGKQVFVRPFESRRDAESNFDEALAVSRDRGWTVIYNGPRLNCPYRS